MNPREVHPAVRRRIAGCCGPGDLCDYHRGFNDAMQAMTGAVEAAKVHVSVSDGDVTVWVVAGHAYPFDTAAHAVGYLTSATISGGADDDRFMALLRDRGCVWDDRPGPLRRRL